MVRTYKRKTERAKAPPDEMQRAATAVIDGRSIRSVAAETGINRNTLQRYMQRKEKGITTIAYGGTALAKRVFTPKMEKELADHIKKLSDQFHGLTAEKCRKLACEFAKRNSISVPINWENGLAGNDWFSAFLARHHLSWRIPEATSLGRSTAFNRTTVGEFFDNLANGMDRYKFPPNMIYNVDETGVGNWEHGTK
ncbi:uncharacterized protein zgc:113274 [Cololabis saira]|uniref:uncharacterized protein zgc:113274 n=1 Tax=Cololabis saira TaxID=129043 RepID=UPI002AD4EAB5|nr:uncharacterized protein zgc:113274 [Cololabis saira]